MSPITGSEIAVDASEVRAALAHLELDPSSFDDLLSALPGRAIGVVLYGSQARGDSSLTSDVDLLVVSDRHSPTRSLGAANISTYGPHQFLSARGTLFGMHLARDGVVLHDAGGVALAMEEFGPIDPERLWSRVEDLASLLRLPESEKYGANLPGFVRHARYVLRTATYARAIREGNPCFSVHELSERFDDPALKVLLSSHPAVTGPPTTNVLEELSTRILSVVGTGPEHTYMSLADLIVGEQLSRPELADSALLVLKPTDDGPYTEIPRVIL